MRDVEGFDPALASKLPDNDEIFAQSMAANPLVVLGFGLSNEGDFRPQVKAGFAFVGEKPHQCTAAYAGGHPAAPAT